MGLSIEAPAVAASRGRRLCCHQEKLYSSHRCAFVAEFANLRGQGSLLYCPRSPIPACEDCDVKGATARWSSTGRRVRHPARDGGNPRRPKGDAVHAVHDRLHGAHCSHLAAEIPGRQRSLRRGAGRRQAPGAGPVGGKVRVRASYLRNEGRRYIFAVEAYAGDLKIGDGTHERVVVDPSRFQSPS